MEVWSIEVQPARGMGFSYLAPPCWANLRMPVVEYAATHIDGELPADFVLSRQIPDDFDLLAGLKMPPSAENSAEREASDQLLLVFGNVNSTDQRRLAAWLLQAFPFTYSKSSGPFKELDEMKHESAHEVMAKELLADEASARLPLLTMTYEARFIGMPFRVFRALVPVVENEDAMRLVPFRLAVIGGALVALWEGSFTSSIGEVEASARPQGIRASASDPVADIASRYVLAILDRHAEAAVRCSYVQGVRLGLARWRS